MNDISTLNTETTVNRGFIIDRGFSDVLKVIAALLVMTSHFLNVKAAMGAPLNSLEWLIRSQGGNVGVAVFFFLSGYGLMMSEMKSHLTFKQYVRRRFLKIYLPVLLVTAIWLPIAYLIVDGQVPTATTIIIDLFLSFKDPVLWFVQILLMLYAAFYLYAFCLNKMGGGKSLCILLLCVAIISLSALGLNGSFGMASLSAIPLFGIGVVTAQYHEVRRLLPTVLLMLVICFLIRSGYCSFSSDKISLIAHSFVDYSIIALIMIVCWYITPKIALPSIFALVTFDVYLLHCKILMAARSCEVILPYIIFAATSIILALTFNLLRRRFLHI